MMIMMIIIIRRTFIIMMIMLIMTTMMKRQERKTSFLLLCSISYAHHGLWWNIPICQTTVQTQIIPSYTDHIKAVISYIIRTRKSNNNKNMVQNEVQLCWNTQKKLKLENRKSLWTIENCQPSPSSVHEEQENKLDRDWDLEGCGS